MMLGIGETPQSVTNPVTGPVSATHEFTQPTFSDGLSAWKDPGAAVGTLQSAFTESGKAFSTPYAQYTLGLLAVPAAAILLLMSMGKR